MKANPTTESELGGLDDQGKGNEGRRKGWMEGRKEGGCLLTVSKEVGQGELY